MSMIKAENLSFSYPGSFDPVFENVSFQIDSDWRLGFIGRNGRGKTTFLRLLMNEFEYSGRLISAVSFDYFPYHVEDGSLPSGEVLRKVCPNAENWQLMRELSLLGIAPELLEQSFMTLSGGEQTKALLAALFLNEGRFLLIDEPTNHLDAEARQKVSDYLRSKAGFILVSHDRAFLDNCVDHILSINRSGIEVQSGNFSSWYESFGQRQCAEEAQNERLKKDISRLQQSARRSSEWSARAESAKYDTKNSGLRPDRGFVGHKAEKMMKRAKSIESRREQAALEKSLLLKDAETADSLKLLPLVYHSERLAELKNVSLRYDRREIVSDISFEVLQGERVAISGRNGSGKSSVLKLILGESIDHDGTVNVSSGLVVSYVPQDSSHLCGSLSEYAREQRIDEALLKAYLRKMDFKRTQFEKDMKDFSAGQKKKVLLAKSLCDKAHLYIWDEPLNYIDIYSRIQIEELILENCPTLVFIEHDRSFSERIATKAVSL